MKSDHAHRNANSETVTTELRLIGSTIDRKVRQAFAAVDPGRRDAARRESRT